MTTPFGILMFNDRFHLVADVIDRVPGLAVWHAALRHYMLNERLRCREHTRAATARTPPTSATGPGRADPDAGSRHQRRLQQREDPTGQADDALAHRIDLPADCGRPEAARLRTPWTNSVRSAR